MKKNLCLSLCLLLSAALLASGCGLTPESVLEVPVTETVVMASGLVPVP